MKYCEKSSFFCEKEERRKGSTALHYLIEIVARPNFDSFQYLILLYYVRSKYIRNRFSFM